MAEESYVADDATRVKEAYDWKVRTGTWDYPILRMLLEGNMSPDKPEGWIPFTPTLRELLQDAYKIARKKGDNWLGMEHIAQATDHYGRRIKDVGEDIEEG